MMFTMLFSFFAVTLALDWKDHVATAMLAFEPFEATTHTTDSRACLDETQLDELTDSVVVIRSSLAIMDNALTIAALFSPEDADTINAIRGLIDSIDGKLVTQLNRALKPGYCATCQEIHAEVDLAVNDILSALDMESSNWRHNDEYDSIEELIELMRATFKMVCPGTEWPTTWPMMEQELMSMESDSALIAVDEDCLTPTQQDSLNQAITAIKSSLRIMDSALATAAIWFPAQRESIVIIRDLIDQIDGKLILELQAQLVAGYCGSCTQIETYIDATVADMYATLDQFAPGWRDNSAYSSIGQIITILQEVIKMVCN